MARVAYGVAINETEYFNIIIIISNRLCPEKNPSLLLPKPRSTLRVPGHDRMPIRMRGTNERREGARRT